MASMVRRLGIALQVMCTGLMIWSAGAGPAWSATRHVVLLFDERPELPGLAVLEGDLVRTLASNSADHIEVYREAMDLSRFGSESYQTLLRDFLRTKYANKKVDVAVAIIGPALDFLLNHGDAIFPGTPIVFCGIDRRELGERSLPPHVHGILVKREFAPTLEIALGLHPQTKRITVIAGTSEFDTRIVEQAREEFRPYEDRVAFTYLTALPLQKQLAELSQLPPQTIVLFATFFQDGAGEPFVPHDVVQRVSAAASAPVYGFVDQYLGRGIVGGSLYSFSAHGSETAKVALRVLAGSEPPGPSFSEGQASKPLFDWQQMQRWGISESSLPAGSEIRFREATAWERYRWQISAVFAALLLQGALITWLLYEHRRRNLAEVMARNSMSQVAHMNRIATAGELSASIAHEISQPVGAIGMWAESALNWLALKTPSIDEARSDLTQIVSDTRRASDIIANVRAMFKKDPQDARPVDLNRVILTVLDLMRSELDKHKIEVRTQLSGRLPPVTGHETQLQQVVLNLVMNAMEAMHSVQSRPHELLVKSEFIESDGVHVAIEDSGTGITPADLERIFTPLFTTKTSGMGMGLSICYSIVESHRGRIWATAGATAGSKFEFVLPASPDKN
jgi:signal transduction histidine kinase